MHYCRECAAKRGYMPSIPTKFAQNSYQLEKYIKHTRPSSSAGKTGVYTWPASERYKDFTVAAVASGHVEVDPKKGRSIVWVASAQTGFTWQSGTLVGPADAVRVVCFQDSSTLHSFPLATSDLKVGNCADCGRGPALVARRLR